MSRVEAWLLHAAAVLVGGSGLVYAWMRYLLRPADEFAVVNHPLQPAMQHAHVVVAPLLVFALGLIWQRHVAAGLKSGKPERRRTGLWLLLALVPMVLPGYLLQVSVDPWWRSLWAQLHLWASVAWLLAYGAHQLLPRPTSRGLALGGRGGSSEP